MKNKLIDTSYWFRPVRYGVELFVRRFDGQKWDGGKSHGIFNNEKRAISFLDEFLLGIAKRKTGSLSR